MQRQDYTFVFSFFGKKVQTFHWNDMGIVVEKEPDVICVYGTDNTNSKILCAVPLCHPKYLKGEGFRISFFEDGVAAVKVADVKVLLDFASKTCSNNKGLQSYGSDAWGQEVSRDWTPALEQRFE